MLCLRPRDQVGTGNGHRVAGPVTAGVVPQAFFTPRPEAGPSGDTPADRVAEAVMSRKSDNAFPRRFTIREEARTQLGRAWQGYLRCGPAVESRVCLRQSVRRL